MTGAERGDIVLVRSRGLPFALARAISGNPYDHAAVVVSGGMTANIDKPCTRLLPEARLLRRDLHPVVLRPRFADDGERAGFVAWMESLVGKPYDAKRTLRLIPRILARRFLRVWWPHEDPGIARERWICTDAILIGLERHVRGFAAIRELELEWTALRCGTTNDFLAIEAARPDLLARIAVPGID